MTFVVEKDPGVIPAVLTEMLDNCVTGITLADPDEPDMPLVYANAVFERMTGYGQDETIGHNCRFLQGEDTDQPEVAALRDAIAAEQSITVTLRNYRKDGTLFYNRLSLTPLRDPRGRLIYYLGVQYDITAQVEAEAENERLRALLDQGGSEA
ncbi:PAS domain S-box-containing protein [Alkalispirillum mobile]|uniref:PAS domain S-box-containing protein n=1 Tax=Alkalispirillum mobile TaxID=85925 RepID=A0A498CFN0_9GAMM|nr:PAS domain-containing protein [Alkalispirillum mobile]RLK51101.1 PAS domain S-box-containing protein [Alkalispirillum mobile]